jgi:hypothetical protein
MEGALVRRDRAAIAETSAQAGAAAAFGGWAGSITAPPDGVTWGLLALGLALAALAVYFRRRTL